MKEHMDHIYVNQILDHKKFYFTIPAGVIGYECCWIFGDDFSARSFEQYFKQRKSSEFNSYIKAHFDTTGFFNNRLNSENPSVISRYVNLMPQAINACKRGDKLMPLPNLVVIVPDDDLIQVLDGCDGDITKNFSWILNFIMMEHERCVATFKEHLPAKSIREYPFILWIHAPLHDGFTNNNLRHKFNRSLDETARIHSNVTSLMLKRVWNVQDNTLYLHEHGRFTCDGYHSYWEAVDCTTRYFHSIILKKSTKEKKKNGFKNHRDQKDQNPF